LTNKLQLFSPNSVRSQLLVWLLGPLLVIGMLAIYDGYRSARTTADSVSDRVLSGSALAIAERVFVSDDGILEVDIPYIALQMLTSSEDDRVFYRIESEGNKFVTGYRALELPPSWSASSEVTFHDGFFRGDPIRIALYAGAASSSTKSFGFRVAVAETTNGRTAIAHSILVRSLIRQAMLLLGTAILVWFVVARALRPLQRLEQAVSRRSPDDVRPIEHQVPNEVKGLVFTINELLGRFASSITALQNFTSNTSHQFRTPLALIKTHLEVATREENPAQQKEAIDLANTAVGEAERLMSQMLLLARLDTASTAELRTKTCDLSAVAREVCEEFVLQLSHQRKTDVDLGFRGDDVTLVYGDKTLVQEVVRNLVDNAIKHSGQAPKIDVVVTKASLTGTVSVCDHGKGFDPAAIQPQGKPKLKSSDNAIQSSAGLGLSIVNEIVTLLDAKLTIEKTVPPPGMTIAVTFKATP